MKNPEIDSINAIENVARTLNDLRIDRAVSCDPAEQVALEVSSAHHMGQGRMHIGKLYGLKSTEADAADAIELHMRLHGKSELTAQKAGEILAKISCVSPGTIVPALFSHSLRSRSTAGIVLFGDKTSDLASVQLFNGRDNLDPFLSMVDTYPQAYSRGHSFRFCRESREWKIGYYQANLSLKDLVITDDPMEFAHNYDPAKSKNSILLVGSVAVMDALELIAGEENNPKNTETMRKILKKIDNPSEEIADVSVEVFVEELFLQIGKTRPVRDLSASLHALVSLEYDQMDIVNQILSRIKNPGRYEYSQRVLWDTLALCRRTRYKDYQQMSKTVRLGITNILKEIGVKDSELFGRLPSEGKVIDVVVALLEYNLKQLPLRKAKARKLMKDGIKALKSEI